MADTLCLRLCKVLCSNGGAMEQGQLARALRLTPEKLSLLIEEEEEGRSLVIRRRDQDRVVVYVSPLRICTSRNQDCAGDCGQLHICRFFILGSCNRPRCKFPHSIDGVLVAGILEKHHLTGVSIPELRSLLLQNDPGLLPDACSHFNHGDGPYGSCTFQSDCNKLHVCQHFLQGDCRFGSQCKRSHDLSEDETKRKLQKWGLAATLLPRILEIYLNANAIRNGGSTTQTPDTKDKKPASPQKSTTPKKSAAPPKSASPKKSASPQPMDEICLYFLLSSCSFKERCVRDHYHLPYRWQSCIDGVWTDLADMEGTERAYCDPNSRIASVDFDAMTYRSHKIRRLSTPSSASKPPHFILTTDWIWYWKDEYDKWVEYGKETSVHQSSSTITSNDLENVFLSDTDEKNNIQFKAGKHKYVLSFKDMIQRNTHYSTERSVCRRPRFVSAEDVKKKKLRKLDPSQAKSTPEHWDKGQVPEVGFKLVLLDQSSEEYKKMDAMFHRTLPDKVIESVERIQNPALWEVYQWQKEQMKKQNGGKDVDERQVFHGTKSDLVDAICHQNFDWRICGTHGTAYGKGSYFARDAAYSDRYSGAESRVRVMFVARVLVGEFTRGSSSYLRPPSKTSFTLYDSCVDSERDPSIFVVFEKHQIYPEYVIRYSERPPSLSANLRRMFM